MRRMDKWQFDRASVLRTRKAVGSLDNARFHLIETDTSPIPAALLPATIDALDVLAGAIRRVNAADDAAQAQAAAKRT